MRELNRGETLSKDSNQNPKDSGKFGPVMHDTLSFTTQYNEFVRLLKSNTTFQLESAGLFPSKNINACYDQHVSLSLRH
jgi:hypothetical protein